jgi:hypothetical protein
LGQGSAHYATIFQQFADATGLSGGPFSFPRFREALQLFWDRYVTPYRLSAEALQFQ